ncbi:MAG: hypothetical protein C0616_09340 [Desulfuromonas sp.]|nr:MAG: hypothetical protein C0616_09340 [Desulfuromonas sp.]
MEHRLTTDSRQEKPTSPNPGQKKRRYRIAAVLILVVGLIFSLAIWKVTREAIHTEERARVEHQAELIGTLIEERINDYVSTLHGLRAFYDASDKVTRMEWQTFVDDLGIGRNFKGSAGFSFIRYVPRQDLGRFLAETREDDAPDFSVTIRNRDADMFIVEFVHPPGDNQLEAGHDLALEESLDTPLSEAVSSRQAALSPTVNLSRASGNQPVAMLFLPVYQKGVVVESGENAWSMLRGWVAASILIEDLLSEIHSHFQDPIDIEILDTSPGQNLSVLFDADGDLHTSDNKSLAEDHYILKSKTRLEIVNRTWTLNLFVLPGFSSMIEHHMPEALLLAGLLLSLVSSFQVASYGKPLARAQRLAEEMTQELRLSEKRFRNMFREHDALMLLVYPDTGRIIDANKSALNFYGYSHDKLTSMKVDELNLLPGDVIAKIREKIISGEADVFNVQHRLASGEIRDMEVHSSPIEFPNQVALFSIIHDVTPRKRAEKALRESEMRFRQIFETNPEPVILLRIGNNTIIDVNMAFETITGIPRREVREKKVDDLGLWVDKDLNESFRFLLAEKGELDHFEAEFRARNGELKTGLISARQQMIDGELCALIVVRDITTEKAIERALIETTRIKSEFLANMSHEIRTPLTVVLSAIEMLQNMDLDVLNQKKTLDLAEESTRRLNILVNEILDFSKIENKKMALEEAEFSIEELMDKTLQVMQLRAMESNVRIALELAPDLPEKVVGDRFRLGQILLNLIGNGIKFTADGDVDVMVTQRDGSLIFSVKDTGEGIPEDKLETIFEAFTQADSSITRRHGGTGLGLTISKGLAELMEGEIKVSSRQDEGTEFILRIPLKLPAS